MRGRVSSTVCNAVIPYGERCFVGGMVLRSLGELPEKLVRLPRARESVPRGGEGVQSLAGGLAVREGALVDGAVLVDPLAGGEAAVGPLAHEGARGRLEEVRPLPALGVARPHAAVDVAVGVRVHPLPALLALRPRALVLGTVRVRHDSRARLEALHVLPLVHRARSVGVLALALAKLVNVRALEGVAVRERHRPLSDGHSVAGLPGPLTELRFLAFVSHRVF
mmetsp:Transcript_24335/g.79415  ORF Transcript_24335/g.79415 Transcript_24335/m.79415 type:complete len:223 (-) Transcript_24335:6-674(-)